MVAVAAFVSSIPLAVAQQYPPPAFRNPGYGAPGGPSSPAYPYPGYGAPGAPPTPQQEVIPAPPGITMVWQPGYWSWRRHGWVWVAPRYVSRLYPHAHWILPIGANDTAAGSGCQGIGDEIGYREIQRLIASFSRFSVSFVNRKVTHAPGSIPSSRSTRRCRSAQLPLQAEPRRYAAFCKIIRSAGSDRRSRLEEKRSPDRHISPNAEADSMSSRS